ncbi:transcription factor DYT1 [Ziziphus jujuba]|uniref:Transcription factor DYT1 n=1 Tax=Ziziphus jujuba TaxID=326968 RepID=A0ABM4A1S8_ZIZJJ|nr:transcription factor DYT1 [Ziziphus jujuba]
MDELSIDRNGSNGGRMGRRRLNEDTEFKSKNLHAERRRRQKLRDRLLKLRALVPIITNMNKATIIEDAITYIEELQQTVDTLTNQLSDNKSSFEEGADPTKEEIHVAEGMKKFGIQEEVNVSRICENKLWIKMVFEKKRGRLIKLLEAMSTLGLELTDTAVTTSKGAMLVTSCVEGFCCEKLALEEAKKLLLQIINGI